MRLPDKVYDVLKWVALIALNAVGLCYRTLAMIWNWPFGEQVQQTCAAISVLIGALIGISSANYYKDNFNTLNESMNEQNNFDFLDEQSEENESTFVYNKK